MTTIATPRRSERLAAKAAREAADCEAAERAIQEKKELEDQRRFVNNMQYFISQVDKGTTINQKMVGMMFLFKYCVAEKPVLQRPKFAGVLEVLRKKVQEMQQYRTSTEISAPALMEACDLVEAALL